MSFNIDLPKNLEQSAIAVDVLAHLNALQNLIKKYECWCIDDLQTKLFDECGDEEFAFFYQHPAAKHFFV